MQAVSVKFLKIMKMGGGINIKDVDRKDIEKACTGYILSNHTKCEKEYRKKLNRAHF
ncbi:hypothetical protein [Campylobacter portucalensis]|uniref:hypothetical protein n=1 Tax=Campylobacter portucalensis TaxID=2608384 RepID=UPI001E521249|nr:hypothetical protein [Campylobacter portucalensis]